MSDTQQLDERRGVPSASGMDRLHNCPASFEMERHAPPEEQREDAASGTRIHAVLAGLAAPDTLSAAEIETHDMCEAQAEQVMNEWAQPSDEEPDMFYEQRIGITQLGGAVNVTPTSKAVFRFTGQADMIIVDDDRALVIDYKTGRGDTPVAQDNPQLAALAVLVFLRYKVTSVRVAIVQPWAGKPTVADYSEGALHLAHSWLITALNAAETATPDDARSGDHCSWCRAKPICWAWKKQAERVANTQLIPTDSVLAQSLSPLDVAEFDALCSRVISQAKKGKAWVQALVLKDAARYASHFTTDTTEGRATITDLNTVWQRVEQDGIPHDKFLACLTARKDDSKATGLPGLKGELRRALKLKGRALDNKLDAVLDGCITEGKKKTIAVRIGADSIEDGDGQLE